LRQLSFVLDGVLAHILLPLVFGAEYFPEYFPLIQLVLARAGAIVLVVDGSYLDHLPGAILFILDLIIVTKLGSLLGADDELLLAGQFIICLLLDGDRSLLEKVKDDSPLRAQRQAAPEEERIPLAVEEELVGVALQDLLADLNLFVVNLELRALKLAELLGFFLVPIDLEQLRLPPIELPGLSEDEDA